MGGTCVSLHRARAVNKHISYCGDSRELVTEARGHRHGQQRGLVEPPGCQRQGRIHIQVPDQQSTVRSPWQSHERSGHSPSVPSTTEKPITCLPHCPPPSISVLSSASSSRHRHKYFPVLASAPSAVCQMRLEACLSQSHSEWIFNREGQISPVCSRAGLLILVVLLWRREAECPPRLQLLVPGVWPCVPLPSTPLLCCCCAPWLPSPLTACSHSHTKSSQCAFSLCTQSSTDRPYC